ncbi:MAG: hypothetical protein IT340_21290 [Chloroflexi bacterium]|nr:hypothetical protein [Chloroflexota bacterium]
MRRRQIVRSVAALGAALVAAGCGVANPPPTATVMPTVAPTAPASVPNPATGTAGLAPELTDVQWFNSPPLTLAEARGQPVFLVFWSTI